MTIGVRMLDDRIATLDAWIAMQDELQLSRPEAIRRLVEIGLAANPKASPTERLSAARESASAARAVELAAKVIEKKLPADTPPDEKAVRKRKLLQRPSVFRDSRKDRTR